jgi:hypothetical protein
MLRLIASLAFVVVLGLFGWGVYNNQHATGNGLQTTATR